MGATENSQIPARYPFLAFDVWNAERKAWEQTILNVTHFGSLRPVVVSDFGPHPDLGPGDGEIGTNIGLTTGDGVAFVVRELPPLVVRRVDLSRLYCAALIARSESSTADIAAAADEMARPAPRKP